MTGGIAPGVGLAGGRFLIEELLGTGGMAAVYRAYDSVLGRTVAIKTMGAGPAADPTGRERFRREARAAAALSHAHVVAVHDVLEEEIAGARIPYLVMEYVRGRPLSRLVPSRPGGLPLAEVLRFDAEILDALAASHACGLVHRDVKPANAMVTEDGSVKAMDFGIARALDGQATAVDRRAPGAPFPPDPAGPPTSRTRPPRPWPRGDRVQGRDRALEPGGRPACGQRPFQGEGGRRARAVDGRPGVGRPELPGRQRTGRTAAQRLALTAPVRCPAPVRPCPARERRRGARTRNEPRGGSPRIRGKGKAPVSAQGSWEYRE
ncbi:hypothetical protein GCM10010406_39830 [Streptomyces thermolineatus]|uniref:Protein kinase domain-containing protein n=1 Tax=Streptomyces thermolineatus TaxID=44033 RepID=A0ABN3MC64_9ACTN